MACLRSLYLLVYLVYLATGRTTASAASSINWQMTGFCTSQALSEVCLYFHSNRASDCLCVCCRAVLAAGRADQYGGGGKQLARAAVL